MKILIALVLTLLPVSLANPSASSAEVAFSPSAGLEGIRFEESDSFTNQQGCTVTGRPGLNACRVLLSLTGRFFTNICNRDLVHVGGLIGRTVNLSASQVSAPVATPIPNSRVDIFPVATISSAVFLDRTVKLLHAVQQGRP
ncbi:uncharacterized protein EI97DRAFT_499720 [Westerdykella ornata]|uniref:Secreted protein n=1 Tax=Westerdykella ornata TaxID=318751 RepID=A0A6A6JNM7_WESOR|nr:uncharacterized protein EI97DRAFT_499720 [Westerdykella ornata]KAF2278221.1 hypothetical protein EI97DRAFT_499720 [Westerdykella ornata]